MSNAIPEDLKMWYSVACDGIEFKPGHAAIKTLIERIAAAEAERDALRNQIPPQGDGSCDRCGRVPSIAIPTSLCEECRDGVARAEKAEAELATARQTIERLSAPVSDAENKYLFDLHDVLSEQDREPAPDIRKAVNALIAARKDANDKEKA